MDFAQSSSSEINPPPGWDTKQIPGFLMFLKKTIPAFVVSMMAAACCFSQGTVRGKITDENGETIIGATVVQKTNHSVWSVADLDGNYALKIPDSLPQIMVISFISYQTIEEPVQLRNGEVVVRNFILKTSAHETKEVNVVAKAVKSREYYTEMIKRNSPTTLDYISSETMKKTGDANVVAAVSRITGVSTNGSFITVRGIGDRYVKTSINGSRIPTLDPFTNNIRLDIFPSSMVDNILITKTASPDLPGDWAGAYLSVETKDYPDELSVNVEATAGYNNQSTFKDFLTTQRSSTDWLGYDNSFRDRSHENFATANAAPTQYEELVALGLGNYFHSMGITGWTDNSTTGDEYFKLGLIQLGLLAPAQFNDDAAFAAAKNLYTSGNYKAQAYSNINADVPSTGQSFPANWNTFKRKAPLNFSQTLTVGNQVKLFGKPLGFLLGYRYGNSIQYDPHSISNRPRSDRGLSSSADQEVSKETDGWSALINLAYKFTGNHSVALLFMPNLTGVNNILNSLDTVDASNNYVLKKNQFYEQRRQMIYQWKSEHYFPSLKLKAELNASYTRGNSSAPDFKNIEYWWLPSTQTYEVDPAIRLGAHRYYRYLSDNLFDSRLAAEFPIGNEAGLVRKIKFGGAYQRNDKANDQYDYQLLFKGNSLLENDDLDEFFSLDKFVLRDYNDINGYPRTTIDDYYFLDNSPAYHTFGKSEIIAGFVMTDYALSQRIRISGGVRVEVADIFTDVREFDSLNYKAFDPRRVYSSSYPIANPGELHDLDFLPSVNIIYKLKKDDAAPSNLRINFSRTVARPSMRELSDVALLDYEYREFVFGNSDLKSVHVNNYDVRYENYFKSGDNISVSLFYKSFKDHIELVKSVGLTWQNVDKSYVAGIELEGKKILSHHLEAGANVALINSQTNFVRGRMDLSDGIKNYIPQDTLKRTMFGQAPFVVNAIVTYKADSAGFTATLSYNVQGARLVITSDNKEIPDVYELPRHLLDLKLSKKLGKHFNVSLTMRDLLNSPVVRSYKEWDIVYDRISYGTNYVLGISYKL